MNGMTFAAVIDAHWSDVQTLLGIMIFCWVVRGITIAKIQKKGDE